MEEIFKGLLEKATKVYLDALKETTKGIYRSFNDLKKEVENLRTDLKIISVLSNKDTEQDGKIQTLKENVEELKEELKEIKGKMDPVFIKTAVLFIIFGTSGVIGFISIVLSLVNLWKNM